MPGSVPSAGQMARSKHPRFVLEDNDGDADDDEDEDNHQGHQSNSVQTHQAEAEAHSEAYSDTERTVSNGKTADPLTEKAAFASVSGAGKEHPHNDNAVRERDENHATHKDSATVPSFPPGSKEGPSAAESPMHALKRRLPPLPPQLAWITPHLNWKGLRPVLRSSVAAWCGMLLLINHRSQVVLGQASFLVLIVAAISPPSAPIATTLEVTFFQFLLVASSWAWACIAIAIAHAARVDFQFTRSQFNAFAAQKFADSTLTGTALAREIQLDIFHGAYLESQSSAVCAIFFGVGAGFLLWLRGYLGPGPQLFGIILAIILQAICLTIAVLFPYSYYDVGLIFFLPFACQEAINLTCAILIVPETLAHQFAERLVGVLTPLQRVIQQQKEMLHTNPRSLDWLKYESLKAGTTQAMGASTLLGASEQNLVREISYGRVNGPDLVRILASVRILVTRATGFVQFYEVVRMHLHRDDSHGDSDEPVSTARGGPVADALVVHMARSRPASREHTPESSRAPSPSRSRDHPMRAGSDASDPRVVSAALARAGGDSSEEGGAISRTTVSFQPPQLYSRHSTPHAPSPLVPARSHHSSNSLTDLDRIDRDSEHENEHEQDHERGHPLDNHSSSRRHRSGIESVSAGVSMHDAEAYDPQVLHHRTHGHLHGHVYGSKLLASSTRSSRELSPTRHRHRGTSQNRHRHGHGHGHGKRGHGGSSHVSLPSLLHDVLRPHIDAPKPVGIQESLRYLDLEDLLHNPQDEAHLEEIIQLLSKASCGLLNTLDQAVGHLITTIDRLKATEITWRLFQRGSRQDEAMYEQAIARSEAQLEELERAISEYKDIKRLEILEPFATLLHPHESYLHGHNNGDGSSSDDATVINAPSHRGLYWVLSYQWHLISWSEALRDAFKETVAIERKRRKRRLWFPRWAKVRFLRARGGDDAAAFEDEDPDAIDQLDRSAFTAARHPDYRPPKSRTQLVGIALHNVIHFFGRKDFLFAFKIATVLALVSMPAYFRSTAWFFYRERGIWVVIMTALTSTAFVGDTVYGFVVRIVGTLGGAALGLCLWYIASGSGSGNPYTFALVCAIAFPFIFFWRVHYMPPIEAILPVVTTMLIIGYSWQGGNAASYGSVGFGWSVGWRRAVCVGIGITIAFVVAYIPPSVTQKGTIRRTYAKVTGRLGGTLCQILSFANCKQGVRKPPRQIMKDLATLRAKVAKTTQRKTMVKYEISLRGPWPEEHYTALQSLLVELLDLLGQFLGVVASLDGKWTTALLHRSQLANPVFLGDLLTTFQLIATALESGTPLPMIYNPLLERFLRSPEAELAHRPYAYDVTLGEEIDGLPKIVTLDTVKTIEYLRFAAGVSQCYAIVNRIDRLMLVSKALVGEKYILYGLSHHHRHVSPSDDDGDEDERRWLHEETPRDSIDEMV